jgi:hypothetical protein
VLLTTIGGFLRKVRRETQSHIAKLVDSSLRCVGQPVSSRYVSDQTRDSAWMDTTIQDTLATLTLPMCYEITLFQVFWHLPQKVNKTSTRRRQLYSIKANFLGQYGQLASFTVRS